MSVSGRSRTPIPRRPEPVDREVVVEAGAAMETEPLHHGEGRAIEDRDRLIRKRPADLSRALEVSSG
jgi:hypothetical protein